MKISVVAISMALLGSALPALALGPCDAVVYEEGVDELTPAQEARVRTAAAKLEELGAVVRIRVSKDAGSYSSLDAAADSVCPVWGNARIVYWVTTDSKEFTVLAGGAWSNQIDKAGTGVIADAMIPGLQSGSFATAFLQAIEFTLPKLQPLPAPPVVIAPRERVVPVTPVLVTERPAANEWSFATALGAILSVILSLLGLYAWKQYTKNRNRRQGAITLGNQCRELLSGFNVTSTRIEAALKSAESKLSTGTLAPFRQELATTLAVAETVNREFNGHTDPEQLQYGFGAVDSLYESLNRTKESLDKVNKKLLAIETDLDERLTQVASLPEQIISLNSAYDDVNAEFARATVDGLMVEDLVQLVLAEGEDLNKLSKLVIEKRFDEAFAIIEETTAVIAQSRAQLATRRQLRDQVKAEYARLEGLLKEIPKKLAATEAIFDTLENEYAESLLETVAGNGTEAEERLDAMEAGITQATAAIKAQDFTAAMQYLSESEEVYKEAVRLLKAIEGLAAKLAAAKIDAATELSEAETSIERAVMWIGKNDDTPDPKHLADLSEGKRLCEKVRALLSMDKPDYIQALTLATQADALADEVLKLAQGEKEREERELARVAALFERAQTDMVEARRYVKNHYRDMSSETIAMVDDVTLDSVSDQNRAAVAARWAKAAAELLATAQADFARAESRRARAREQSVESLRSNRESKPDSNDSAVTTRQWGAPSRPSASAATTSTWRSAAPVRSVSTTRSFTPAARAASVSTTRKW